MDLIAKDNLFIGIPSIGVIFEFRVFVDGQAAGPGAGRVTTLNDEVGYDAMEDGTIVVAIETVLEEVFGGERRLFCEEGNMDWADGCVKRHARGRQWFGVVM